MKQERKKLAHDKDALENKLKWENILGMPVVVVMAGIGLAVVKRKRHVGKMNRKQFVILLVLLVVLGGAGLLVQRGKDNCFQRRRAGAGKKLAGRKIRR